VSLEARFGWLDEDWERLRRNVPEGWRLERATLAGKEHASMVWPGTYLGLKTLFADYSTVASSRVTPVERLRGFDDTRRGPMSSVPPPSGLLIRAAEDLIGARELEGAERIVDRLATGYGETEALLDSRARLEAARSEPLEGPTLEEMRATPVPSSASWTASPWGVSPWAPRRPG